VAIAYGVNMPVSGRRRRKPKRRGYVRRSRAQPKTGWTLRELGQLTGVTPRALRLYLQRRVLPAPPFKGSATRYQRKHALCVLAIQRWLTESQTLAQIRPRLHALDPQELECFATERLTPGALATALGVAVGAPPPAPAARAASSTGTVLPRWTRAELMLGLELHLREDAAPAARDLANRIWQLSRTPA
jgi:DNA-binding transcriptional MerR regulator